MKKDIPVRTLISPLLLGILCSVGASGQISEIEPSKTNWITVGEIKWLGGTRASLKYFVIKEDTTFMLYLQDDQKLKNSRDMSVTKNFSIHFNGNNNTVGKLYDLLTSFFTDENRKNKKLEKVFSLGDQMVYVQHYPKLTAAAILFSTKENHIAFTERELKKLFGKQNL